MAVFHLLGNQNQSRADEVELQVNPRLTRGQPEANISKYANE